MTTRLPRKGRSFYQLVTDSRHLGYRLPHRNNSDVAMGKIKDEQGNFVHHCGISPVSNFYFIDRPWQRPAAQPLLRELAETLNT